MARKGQIQTNLKLIMLIASMAEQAVDAINKIWSLLNEDDRLSEGMRKLLNSLREAAKVKDPLDRARQSLAGIDTYLRDQPDVPVDRSEALRGRSREIQRRVDLAKSLDGADRRRVLKTVKKDVADLLKQTLTLGVQTETRESQSPHSPEQDPSRGVRIGPIRLRSN